MADRAQAQPVSIFGHNSLHRLTSGDFRLDTPDMIGLKDTNCIIVLFYGMNRESLDMINIWSQVAQESAGPIMAACNIVEEQQVALAMANIKASGNHPLHWASMRGYPFILSYRGGWPAAFYNGDRSVQAILDWVMTLACQANYYERFDLSGGVQTTNTASIPNPSQYPSTDNTNPIRTQSTQYRTNAPIRTQPGTPTSGAAGGTPATPGTQVGAAPVGAVGGTVAPGGARVVQPT